MKKITSKNYVQEVLRTESCDLSKIKERLKNPEVVRLLHAGMGLVTEAGEFMDMLKKHVFYGKDIDYVNAIEELGDELWYIGVATDVCKATLNDVLSRNIEKLRKRYPEKFSEKRALNRDLKTEREVLDKGTLIHRMMKLFLAMEDTWRRDNGDATSLPYKELNREFDEILKQLRV